MPKRAKMKAIAAPIVASKNNRTARRAESTRRRKAGKGDVGLETAFVLEDSAARLAVLMSALLLAGAAQDCRQRRWSMTSDPSTQASPTSAGRGIAFVPSRS